MRASLGLRAQCLPRSRLDGVPQVFWQVFRRAIVLLGVEGQPGHKCFEFCGTHSSLRNHDTTLKEVVTSTRLMGFLSLSSGCQTLRETAATLAAPVLPGEHLL